MIESNRCRRSTFRVGPPIRWNVVAHVDARILSNVVTSAIPPLATLNSSLICRARRISGMDPRLLRNELVFSFPIYVDALAKYRDKRSS